MGDRDVTLTAEDIPKLAKFLNGVGDGAIKDDFSVGNSGRVCNMSIEHEGLEIRFDMSWPGMDQMTCDHLFIECHGKLIASWSRANDTHPEVFDEFCRRLINRRKRFEKAHPTESELVAARHELRRIIGR